MIPYRQICTRKTYKLKAVEPKNLGFEENLEYLRSHDFSKVIRQ